ncbi:MAG TPA: hypothetical protein PK668_03675 [Myxococcota bacterium]|nr:hypothetical protein [Myxococcota bacterium]HRY91956.1 hypothetical protein [Myxococcota bacterium]HSA20673.1 hypothetical protein [Myxococcota bacterium]
MDKLAARLPLPERRKEIVEACVGLLETEVGRKTGMSGLAVKTAYKVFKAIKPGLAREAIDGLLDDFVDSLDPLHGQFQAEPRGSFGGFLKGRAHEAAEALLGVTDRRADGSRHTTLVKLYRKLRPAALRNVEEAVPGLGDLFDRFYRP